ncbi:MAG TPA: acyloxyacyl hydrolase [Gemmatimonadaceae bacterium]|jgi:hypothetical protein
MARKTCLSCAAALATLILVLGGVQRAAAQASAATKDTSDGGLPTLMLRAPSTYGGWIAAARHSAFRTRTGAVGYRDFYLASARFGWQVGGDDASPVRVTYFIDVIPAAVSTGMPEYQWDSRCQPTTFCPGATPIPHNVYGFGLAPIGWSLGVGNGRARLTIEAAGGGLWFDRRVPDPLAARFNFTASAGPTLELRLRSVESLRLGYLWHHTSNGGTGHVNPGLNSGILTAGLLWRALR